MPSSICIISNVNLRVDESCTGNRKILNAMQKVITLQANYICDEINLGKAMNGSRNKLLKMAFSVKWNVVCGFF